MQKEKLRQSLYLQDKGLAFDDGSLFLHSGGTLFNDDATSLDSKESAESGEVITGRLIDFDEVSSEMSRRHSIPVPITIIRPTSDDDETDSASIISSSSSSSGTKSWDIDDIIRNDRPVPPPRRKHQIKQENLAVGVGQLIDISSEPTKQDGRQLSGINREQGSESPLNDFTSGIAEGLYNLSKRYSDPLVASTVSNTGNDLFNSVDSRYFTSNNSISTASLPGNNSEKMASIPERPTNDPWKPVDVSPNLSNRTRPPPPKPQPYIGTGPKIFMDTNAKQPGAILTPHVPSQTQTSSQDPLADIFGNGGLHAYAFQQDSSNS